MQYSDLIAKSDSRCVEAMLCEYQRFRNRSREKRKALPRSQKAFQPIEDVFDRCFRKATDLNAA